jgi:para-nitrobenzyl esterase
MPSHLERSIAVLASALTLVSCGSDSPSGAAPVSVYANPQITVATSAGTFTSIYSPTSFDVYAFLGIRYAAPPVGALRWQPPTAPTPSSSTVTASTPGNACPQSVEPITQGEDCLFLNVWVPTIATANSKLPVYFWIHGGSLTEGTGAQFDPSLLVEQNNIIVVTINYRLGALGWLVEPGLLATSANTYQNVGDGGNYGLMDQQFAMQWVQDNIAAFGGDPTKVTIGGESAGGLSITSNLASPDTATGLFRGAIIESGAYMLHTVLSQTAYEAAYGAAFDAALGCAQPADSACLRAASVAQILSAQSTAFGATGIAPDYGNKMLPRSLIGALTSGAFVQVPVLQGTNANEGRLFEPEFFPTPSDVTNAQIVAAGGPANFYLSNANSLCAVGGINQVCTYPQEINNFLQLLGLVGFPSLAMTPTFSLQIAADYPLNDFLDPYLANNAPSSDEGLSQIFTDRVFSCNGLDSNNALSQFVTVYGYEFNDPNAPPVAGTNTAIMPPNDIDGFPTASEHGSELSFLFNVAYGDFQLSANDQQLAQEMKTYWGNFIVSGNPNMPDTSLPAWPEFTSSATTMQTLVPGPQKPAAFTSFATDHNCATWEPFMAAN